MKTIFLTILATGIFSTSLFTTVDLIVKKGEVISKAKSQASRNFDANSRATKKRL